jgi:hypothetical protein
VAGFRRCERTSELTRKPRAIALPDDEDVAWVPDERERIRPFSTGGNYLNSQLSEDDSDRTAAYKAMITQEQAQTCNAQDRRPVTAALAAAGIAGLRAHNWDHDPRCDPDAQLPCAAPRGAAALLVGPAHITLRVPSSARPSSPRLGRVALPLVFVPLLTARSPLYPRSGDPPIYITLSKSLNERNPAEEILSWLLLLPARATTHDLDYARR